MNVSEALRTRISADHYDASYTLDEQAIQELVSLALEAPSSFNIQHVRLVAVTDPAVKKALRAVSYNQPKVEGASAVFVLFGDMLAHEAFAERVRGAVAEGSMPEGTGNYLMNTTKQAFADPIRAREEAVRSAGLMGMALMLAAQERGLLSGPMIGFSPAGVNEVLGAAARYQPLLMVVVGRAAPGNAPRKPRLGLDVALRMNKADF